MKHKSPFWLYATAGLLVLSIGLYVRLYPLFFLPAPQSVEKATVLVLSHLRATIQKEMTETFPKLSETELRLLTQRRFDNILKEEGAQARATIDRTAAFLEKQSPPGERKKYLLAADSYYYYGLTKNILETGQISEKVKGSKYFNERVLAPGGNWEPLNLHPYTGFFTYRILRIFTPEISLMQAVGWTPLIVAALSGIAFLTIGFCSGWGVVSTSIGALFFLLAPVFVKRSSYNWYDNDPYNVLFPLLILGCLFAGFRHIADRKRSGLLAVACGGLFTLYAFFWQGWAYLLCIIALSGAFLVLYTEFFLKQRQNVIRLFWYFGLMGLSVLLGITLAFGVSEFLLLLREGVSALRDFIRPQFSLWPNAYLSVGELKQAGLNDIVLLTGGYVFFAIALFGAASAAVRLMRKNPGQPPGESITLGVFLIVALLFTFGAQRFVLLCLVPLGLFFTAGLEAIIAAFRNKKWSRPAITLIAVLLAAVAIMSATRSLRGLFDPIFNPVWETTLTRIKKETPPEAIINTWWPPGHFIKAVAERRVTFDGGTINTPQAYWMANVFLATDEKKAAGILRMLNNSANAGAEYLQSQGLSLSQAIAILSKITAMDKSQAETFLNGRITPEQTQQLLKFTHAAPPPSYVLVYKELVDKNLELSFIGNWDFAKAEAIRNDPQAARRVPKRGSSDYVQFLWDLAGGPLRSSEALAQISDGQGALLFQENVTINLDTQTCFIRSEKFGTGIPKSLLYVRGNDVVEKIFPNANLNFSVVVSGKEGSRYGLIMDTPLARSLIVRMYFFEGKGLRYFKPFIEESDLTGRTHMYVYQVDWDS